MARSKKKSYALRNGARLPVGVTPQEAGEELARIEKSAKTLTAEIVLKEAKKKSSPIHDCFTWNNEKAAQERRLDQARYLIRCVTVIIETPEGFDDKETRAFVHIDHTPNDRHYRNIEDALASPEDRVNILNHALREVESWQSRFQEYAELTTIFKAISLARSTLSGRTRLKVATKKKPDKKTLIAMAKKKVADHKKRKKTG